MAAEVEVHAGTIRCGYGAIGFYPDGSIAYCRLASQVSWELKGTTTACPEGFRIFITEAGGFNPQRLCEPIQK